MVTRPPTADALMTAPVPAGVCTSTFNEQAVDGAAEQFLVAGHGEAPYDLHLQGPRGIGGPSPVRARRDHGGEVDRQLRRAWMLAEPGEPEHVVD